MEKLPGGPQMEDGAPPTSNGQGIVYTTTRCEDKLLSWEDTLGGVVRMSFY